jgi:hypothetical protein
MDNVRTGEMIAGISGAALFIIMFLNWWGAPGAEAATDAADALGVSLPDIDTTANAWQAADVLDLLWALAAISGMALAVTGAMSAQANMPVALSAITAGLGGLATLTILYRLIDPPFDADREYGVFLGLIAAAGVAYGGWRAMQEEGASFGGEADRLGDPTAGTGAPPPPPPPPPSGQGPAS